MATEDILIRYRADVSQLTADLDKLVKQQEDLVDATKDTNTAINKSVSAQEYAAKKRTQLLAQEENNLRNIKKAQKEAFDPVQIEKYNQQIAQSEKRIDALKGTYNKVKDTAQNANKEILDGINRIAGAFGIAFSAEAVISFAKQTIDAFMQAEEAANRLKNAIVGINGESEAAFNRLIQQSSQLQDITIFSDDDIQAAQTQLANYGLLSNQIEEILPKLADFASVTGTDIVSAAQQIGAGLQGAGREFKKFGIDVNATKTELENFNAISEGLNKFQGQAAKATETLSGQLKQTANEANNLEEIIGSKFAASFTNFKKGALEATAALLGFKEASQQKADTRIVTGINKQLEYAAELEQKYGRQIVDTNQILEERKKTITDLALGIALQNEQAKQQLVEEEKGITATVVGRSRATIKLNEQIEANNELLRQYQVELDYIDGIAAKEKEKAEAAARTLTAEKVRGKSLAELNILLEKQKEKYDIIGQANERIIQAEIDAQKKASEAAKKAAEERQKNLDALTKQLADLDAQARKLKIEAIQPETFDEAIAKINELKKIEEDRINADIAGKKKAANGDQAVIAALEKVRLKQLEVLGLTTNAQELDVFKKITEAAQKAQDELAKLNIQIGIEIATEDVKAATDKVAKAFDELGKSITVSTSDKAQQAVMNETDALNAALQEQAALRKKAIEDQARLDAAAVNEFTGGEDQKTLIYAKAQDEINKIDKETNASITKNNKDANDAIKKNTEDTKAAVLDSITQQAQEFSNLFNEVTGLYNQFAEQQVQSIEKVRDAQLAAIDESLKANQDAYEARAITEREAIENERQLQADRVKAEEEAQKKIREIKRKQAILDKAAALVSIAINTAVAVSKITAEAALASPFLIPLIIAQGAAQAAAVIAQPIPYRKGSKDTGRKGHMARVGEEGEEIVYMPQNSKVLPSRQTRKYGEVIDAMFDNNLDKYINKHYITPALVAQKRAYEGQQSKNFADNMAQSIYYNQTGLTASDLESQRKRGQYIRNVDELANAIAKHLPKYDPYRA